MSEILLKNGQTSSDIRLDRVYQQDLRSLNYVIGDRFKNLSDQYPRSREWGVPQWLDQGQEGACVGFSFCHEALADPVFVTGITDQYAREVYWGAQRIDEWPGGSYIGASPRYEGTSILAGAKEMKKRGFYNSYTWALSAEEMARGIAYVGPCVLGTLWFNGMYNTDRQGFIKPVGGISGGHAILVSGVHLSYKSLVRKFFGATWRDVDFDKSYFILHNSWGPDWGMNGKAKVSLTDMAYLLRNDGEACFPVRNTTKLIA